MDEKKITKSLECSLTHDEVTAYSKTLALEVDAYNKI